MTQPDLNNLRRILDEYEQYANALGPGAQEAAIAKELLAVVAEARAGLRPSADSTANYIEVKQVIERLAELRERAGRAA